VTEEFGWWHRAACRNHDPDWWEVKHRGNAEAIRICQTCPVKVECERDALALGAEGSIRAGQRFGRRGPGTSGEFRTATCCCGTRFVTASPRRKHCDRGCKAARASWLSERV
jgi:hypothetical protein